MSTNSTNSIPQSAPPGSLTVTNPPNTVIPYLEIATNQLPVTFAWSFADVLSTPTSLTVSAVADNGMSFPVGFMTDGAVPGTATSVVWNLYSYDQAHPQSLLPNSTYRLQIADERGMGAGMTPGLLTPYNGSMFVIFSPAASATGRGEQLHMSPAFVSVLATIMIMVLSGFALIRNGLR